MRTARAVCQLALLLALPLISLSQPACHNPANPELKINFLKAATAEDVEGNCGLWRDVPTKLRNRTMPIDSKLTEDDRFSAARGAPTRTVFRSCEGSIKDLL